MTAGKVRFDPNDPQLKLDPYPLFKALRDEDPIHFCDLGFWVATRYDDLRAVVMDRENFGQGDFIKNIQLFTGRSSTFSRTLPIAGCPRFSFIRIPRATPGFADL